MLTTALICSTASLLAFILGLNHNKLKSKFGWLYKAIYYSSWPLSLFYLYKCKLMPANYSIAYVCSAIGWNIIGRTLQMIGLTGGVGSGKSAVTSIVKSSFSREIAIIDCDLVSREVVIPGRRAYKNIVKAFGSKILDSEGCIDRKILGAIVFANKAQRNKLDQIIQPAIFLEIFKKLIYYKIKGYSYVIIDAPILFETKILPWFCFPIITVYVSDEEIQIKRVMGRDKITREEAIQKIQCQWPIELKIRKSNISIDNIGTFEDLELKIRSIFRSLILSA
ncbi:unnamed protein product [Blepharisma stoltei]|uniref:Dephospho-CoA kinase n=1 Tax=Blepharisma stoltei TaxID=1481888 RepID=A0AAU9JHG9_9CILI|nr:unnamed protein product [Blepharisma stoltei]